MKNRLNLHCSFSPSFCLLLLPLSLRDASKKGAASCALAKPREQMRFFAQSANGWKLIIRRGGKDITVVLEGEMTLAVNASKDWTSIVIATQELVSCFA